MGAAKGETGVGFSAPFAVSGGDHLLARHRRWRRLERPRRMTPPLARGRIRRPGDGLGQGGERQDARRPRADPRFAGLFADALRIAQAKDRIPAPELIGGGIYNFWQDADHVRGIWRRTTPADYATPSRSGDGARPRRAGQGGERQLGLAGRGLPAAGGAALPGRPLGRRRGREHRPRVDLTTGHFVPGGFILPRGKQSADWLDAGHAARRPRLGPGHDTASGYPFVVKRCGAARPSAGEGGFRGTPSRRPVDMTVLHDGDGDELMFIRRGATSSRPRSPADRRRRGAARPAAEGRSAGLRRGRLLFTLKEDWTFQAPAATGPAALLASIALRRARRPTSQIRPSSPSLVYAPGPRQSIEQVGQHQDPASSRHLRQRPRRPASLRRGERRRVARVGHAGLAELIRRRRRRHSRTTTSSSTASTSSTPPRSI